MKWALLVILVSHRVKLRWTHALYKSHVKCFSSCFVIFCLECWIFIKIWKTENCQHGLPAALGFFWIPSLVPLFVILSLQALTSGWSSVALKLWSEKKLHSKEIKVFFSSLSLFQAWCISKSQKQKMWSSGVMTSPAKHYTESCQHRFFMHILYAAIQCCFSYHPLLLSNFINRKNSYAPYNSMIIVGKH